MADPITSATGGYLRQTSVSLDGLALRRFIATVLVGLTGVDENLVRPSWQPNPPAQPDITVNWLAFGISSTPAPGTTYHDQHDTTATQVRYEDTEVACTCYGPDCLAIAGALRDALELAQNRDALVANGLNFAAHGDIMHVPEKIGERWFDRADILLMFRREIRREYRIFPFIQATGTIAGAENETAIEINWETT
jgi:hypothetical protein